MKVKFTLFSLILSTLLSCNEYSRTDYPQSVILTPNYTHIIRYHELEVDSLKEIPSNIQNKLTKYLKNRLGEEKFTKLVYQSTHIWSDKPIPFGNSKSLIDVVLYGNDSLTKVSGKGIDSIYNYPLYSSNFQLSVPEIGIEILDINLILDAGGEIIKDIEYPNDGFEYFISIDSIHSELIRRKISSNKLNIHLNYNEKKDTFIWSTNTLISEGSISGPSCFPVVEHHFKMNALTGVMTEYTRENNEEYLTEIY